LEDQCLIPVSVEGLELHSNYSVAAWPLCLSDRLKVQDYETLLVYLWVAISKVCSEKWAEQRQHNSVYFILRLYMDFRKTSHEACATAPKKSPCPPSIPGSRTAKVPIVLLGMCTGMVRFQAQQRPCRRPGHVGAQAMGAAPNHPKLHPLSLDIETYMVLGNPPF
jgi:hypothetical protein